MKERIYLDYNATAPLRPEAAHAMMDVMSLPHNASSVHSYGRAARGIIEDARVKIATLVNAPPAQVIFNSGATEANNTILKFFQGERVLISAVEHPSVREVLPLVEIIPVTRDGVIDLDALERLLKQKKTGLVSVMLVNNETGAIQPIEQAAALAHAHGALFHCDGAQGLGKIGIDIMTFNIDFLSLSSHKIGGPQGVGALVLGLCGITPVLLEGGGQEKKARAGTENIAGIAGFGAAAKAAHASLPRFNELSLLRDALEHSLQSVSPDLLIHAQKTARVANTSFFSLPGASSETMLMAFDLEGLALSNGSACSSGSVKPSSVLLAMGHDEETARGALRVSLGWDTKAGDIDRFVEIWSKIYTRITSRRKDPTHA